MSSQKYWKNMQSLNFLMPKLLNEVLIQRNSGPIASKCPNIEIFWMAPVVILSLVFEWKKRLVDAKVSNIVKMFNPHNNGPFGAPMYNGLKYGVSFQCLLSSWSKNFKLRIIKNVKVLTAYWHYISFIHKLTFLVSPF
jgi:hypothetical protein